MLKNVYGDGVIMVNKTDTYGGVDISVTMSQQYADDIRWLNQYRREYELEKNLRENSQAVKNAWEQYQVVKILAEKEK